MSYTHFTLEERRSLQKYLSEGLSFREIADILGRSPSSISREVKRNRSQKPHKTPNNKYKYNCHRAQALCISRRRKQRRYALKPGTPVWDYIVEGLQKFWSPEAVAGRWHLEHPDEKRICVSTIYRYIKQGLFPTVHVKTHLRRRGKRMQTRKANYNTIHPDRIIPEWPKEIWERLRIGDWEGDTIYGGVGKGLLVSLVDRKSRFLLLGLLSSRSATETRTVIEQMLHGIPVESLSFDNGAEFAEFDKLEDTLHTKVYFAEPHKPWQRGTNENTNDIVRFFFRKGFDFTRVSDKDVQAVADLINDRPRKCLVWLTPREAFSVALA